MGLQKMQDFCSSLSSVLEHYGIEFLESTDIAIEHNYGEGLLDLLKLVDIKKKIDERIAAKRAESFNWKVGIKLIIDEYYNLLANSRYTSEGYEATNKGNNIIIKYVVDYEKWGVEYTKEPYFPIYDYFLGAEIAYILPKLESELSILESETDNTLSILPTIEKQPVKDVDKLQWKKKVSLLVYLFHLLETEKIIQGENLGVNLSKIFLDKDYKEIQNTTINEYMHRFRNLDTKAQGRALIEKIIEAIKEVDSHLTK